MVVALLTLALRIEYFILMRASCGLLRTTELAVAIPAHSFRKMLFLLMNAVGYLPAFLSSDLKYNCVIG